MVNRRPSRLDEGELQKAAPPSVSAEEVWLTVGLLAAPLAWALHLALSYGLVYPAQRWASKAPLYVTSFLAALPAALSIIAGIRGLRHSPGGTGTGDAARERARFLSACACALGVFFLLAILAQSVPVLMLSLGAR